MLDGKRNAREVKGLFSVLKKDASWTALELEVLSLSKEYTGTNEGQNQTHSHQPYCTGWSPAKVPFTMT